MFNDSHIFLSAGGYGDPHFKTFDSEHTSITFDGYGEFVILRHEQTSEIPYILVLVRHNKEPPSGNATESKRTYIR